MAHKKKSTPTGADVPPTGSIAPLAQVFPLQMHKSQTKILWGHLCLVKSAPIVSGRCGDRNLHQPLLVFTGTVLHVQSIQSCSRVAYI